jgi:hypothetical protein
MGANSIPIVLLRHIAVPAKDLKMLWITQFPDCAPPVSSDIARTIDLAVAVYMVDGQKRQFILTTTNALPPISGDHLATDCRISRVGSLLPAFPVVWLLHPDFGALGALSALGFAFYSGASAATQSHCIAFAISLSSLHGARLTLPLPCGRKVIRTAITSPLLFPLLSPCSPIFFGVLHSEHYSTKGESPHGNDLQ